MERWVKIYDGILEWEWADDPHMVSLWVHLLLRANYKDKRWHGIDVKRGQLVTSLVSLSELTGISVQSIRTCLKRLEETGEITIKVTNKYRIITICKYAVYQGGDIADQQTTNKQATNKQQTTNKQLTTTQEKIEEVEDIEDNLSTNKLSNNMEGLLDFFNQRVVAYNSTIPQIRGISGKRQGYVKARLREHGLDAVLDVINKAVTSDFLNGRNNRGWIATFDWMFLPTNFQKILEGNYNGFNTNDKQAKLIADGAKAIAALEAEGGSSADCPF